MTTTTITNSTTLKNLKADMHVKATAYCAAYNEGEKSKKELKVLKEAATQAVAEYNSALEKATYRSWAANGAPAVLTALTVFRIPGAQRPKFKENDDGIMTVSWSEIADYPINLPTLQKTVGADKFANPKWFHMVEKFIFVAMNRINLNHTGADRVDYSIDKASEDFEIPAEVDLTTEEGVGIALQKIFDMICFVPSPEDPEQNAIAVTWNEKNVGGQTVRYALQWERINRGLADVMKKAGGLYYRNTGRASALIADAMHNAIAGEANFAELE